MEFIEERRGDSVVLGLRGKLDVGSAESFDDKIAQLLESRPNIVVLDLSGLAYISSSGFKALLLAGKKIRAAGGRLVLASLGVHLRQLFEVTGFSTLFPTYPTPAAALKANPITE